MVAQDIATDITGNAADASRGSAAETATPTTSSASTTSTNIGQGNNATESSNTSSTAATSTGAASTGATATSTTSSDSIGPSHSMAPATPASNSESNSSGGLGTAAKAGIAVGAAAVVVILAAFLFWKYRRGRKKSLRRGVAGAPHGSGQGVNPGTINPNAAEKGLPTVGGAVLLRSDSGMSEARTPLPQQADDATIQSRFSTLFDQIELHTENFYKDSSPMIPPQTEAALSRYDTPYLGAPLAARLEESPRTTTILKHVLAYEIAATTLTSFSQDRKRSLLPPPVLTLIQDLESRPNQPERRAISTRLKTLAQSYHANPQSMPASTTSATKESAAQFSQTFSLWSDPQHDEARRTKHLTDIFDSAVRLSIWLLRQPEDFEVRWGPTPASHAVDTASPNNPDPSRDAAALVTHPALIKVSRNAGATRLSRSEQKTIAVAIQRRI
ncbi:hypothetical protein PV10_02400 [Exophiala mesophila]|uniref:Uncharacterized protein n=1 Tax=Exophiala mesophila TaxID=212818 RepID=A0A0D1Y272_EXOME|nr:uncharacterized protein PV10_02400 [Exophiala mesophila]KIV94656.1 hypothetical protein PV10_02400 [Exophiala mesophila]